MTQLNIELLVLHKNRHHRCLDISTPDYCHILKLNPEIPKVLTGGRGIEENDSCIGRRHRC